MNAQDVIGSSTPTLGAKKRTMPTHKPTPKRSSAEVLDEAMQVPAVDRKLLLNPNDRAKMQKMKRGVEEQVIANLGMASKEMLDNIYKLAKSAESESVRLKASMDWLDRAGFKPIERVEHSKVARTVEQIEAELVSMLGRETADLLIGKRKIVERQNISEGEVVN